MAGKHIRRVTTGVASLAVVCSFGVGAAALSKGGVEFDPGQFESAYTRGADDDSAKGYRANAAEVDAAANRQGDEREADRSTSQQGLDDAFSDMPIDGQSGTTAYNLIGRASDGLLVGTSNASAEGGRGGSGQGSANGPVIGGDDNVPSGSGDGSGDGQNSNNSANGGGTDSGNNSANSGFSWDEPSSEKGDMSGGGADHFIKVNPNGDNSTLVNLTPEQQASITYRIMEDYWSAYPLYEGQKLDPWTIFCALSASFIYDDPDGSREIYYWACSRDEFDTYNFQITSYPEYASGAMTFGVRFRYSNTCDWIEDTVEYTARDYMVYVTGPQPADGSPAEIFTKMSSDDAWAFPYNLARWTGDVLGASMGDSLSKLFLGWTVNGEPVENQYEIDVERGRYVLSPADFVDVPSGVDATLEMYWVNDSIADLEEDGDSLVFLQGLSSVSEGSPLYMVAADGSSTLVVPNCFQAIRPNSDGIYANKLVVPASVVRIDAGDPNLCVYDAYVVDANNLVYSSTADGVLQSKDGSEYCGIPLNMHTLNVGPLVKKIDFAPGSSVDTLVLQGETLDEVPDLNFVALGECNIVVRDELFDSYIAQYHDGLVGAGDVTVSRASDPSVQFHVENGVVYNDQYITRVLDLGQSSITLRVPHTIKTGAFVGCQSVESVVLDSDEPFVLEDGCFADGNVSVVACKTQEQLEYVSSRLAAAGVPDASVVLLDGNAQGFRWFVSANAEGEQEATLLEAPSNITEFMGSVETDAGEALNIVAIAPGAFSQCSDLRWVQLASSIKTIGSGAFSGCGSLEGVLINSTDVINVEANAFADCYNMGFVASNARVGNFQTDERPNDCMMYAPTDSVGYHRYFITFDAGWDLSGFDTVDVGDGCYVLYGTSPQGSMYEGNWLALASGSSLPVRVTLPASTARIYSGAFAGVATPFNINWDDLADLQVIDGEAMMVNDAGDQFVVPGAFGNTAIAGDVHIASTNADALSIGSYAFSYCENLESVTIEGSGIWLGVGAFFSCGALKSATISNLGWYGAIENGAFSSCDNIRDISFIADDPVDLDTVYESWPFTFLDLWGVDESDFLRIHVPEGQQETYLNAWIYAIAGYRTYDDLYDHAYWELREATGSVPSEAQIKKNMADALLPAENSLRTMLGMEAVDKSSIIDVQQANGATFVTEDGVIQLVELESDAKVIDLGAIIPDSLADEGVQIAEGAFDKCPNMERLIMSSKVNALSNWVLSGQAGVTLVVPSLDAAPMLVGGDWFSPFEFACEDFRIEAPAEIQHELLKQWTYQAGMAVYNEDMLAMYVEMFYSPGDTQEEYDQQFNELFLMGPENTLRGYMGLPTVEDYRELWSFVNTADYVTAHDPDPDDDFWDDDSDWRQGAPNSSERESSANRGDAGNPGQSATSDSASAGDSANADAAAADGASNAGSEGESSSVAAPLNANDGVAACARKETNAHSMP